MQTKQNLLGGVDAIVDSSLKEDAFGGVVIGVETDGKRETKAWGYARKPTQVMVASKLFDMASVTKLFTTTAILRLIDQGSFTARTKILDLLPFVDPTIQDVLKTIDVASLLTHHSGIMAWYPFYTRKEEKFESILSDILRASPLAAKPLYSDLNFMLLGMVVERLAKEPLDVAMQHLVLQPLQLSHTTFHPNQTDCAATEYGNRIEKKMVADRNLVFNGWRDEENPMQGSCNDGNGFYYFNGTAGHAGLFSDADDMLSFGRVYCNKGQETFLPSALLAEALKDYGAERMYGFQCGSLYPQNGFGHTGFTGTYLYLNPKMDVIITILTNRLHVRSPRNINDFRVHVVNILLDALSRK